MYFHRQIHILIMLNVGFGEKLRVLVSFIRNVSAKLLLSAFVLLKIVT